MIWLLFALIQLASLALTVVGLLVLGALSLLEAWTESPLQGIAHWPRWAWIWDNEEDGIFGRGTPHTSWQAFYWSALRNPVANLKHVPGVSKVGRPLYYRTWVLKGKQFYFKAGWMSNGYPAFSAGAGKGF